MSAHLVDPRSAWFPSLCLSLCMACSTPVPSPTARPSPSQVPSAALPVRAEVDPALLDAVCHAEHADRSSTVYRAIGATGDVERLVVTPSRKIADMGNLVFDMSGRLLGHDTGSEVPWDDRAFMASEHARVEKLMGGARIPKESQAIQCR